MHVHATFLDEDGDLDVFLEDEMGVAYASGQSVDDDEDIVWVSDGAGTVCVRVQNYTADACTDYTLLVELDDSTCVYPEICNDDLDNDLDGRTDCADSDCSGSVYLEGACTNPADLPAFVWTDPFVLGFDCVSTQGCGADETCISTCVQDATGLSSDCSDCMATLSACALMNCEASCASESDGRGLRHLRHRELLAGLRVLRRHRPVHARDRLRGRGGQRRRWAVRLRRPGLRRGSGLSRPLLLYEPRRDHGPRHLRTLQRRDDERPRGGLRGE